MRCVGQEAPVAVHLKAVRAVDEVLVVVGEAGTFCQLSPPDPFLRAVFRFSDPFLNNACVSLARDPNLPCLQGSCGMVLEQKETHRH